VLEVEVVLSLDVLEMRGEVGGRDGRERCGPILVALSCSNDDLISGEVDVLGSEPSALEQTETGAIEQERHEPVSAMELAEDGSQLVTGEDYRQADRALGPHDLVEPWQILAEDLPVEEEQGAQRLVLCRGGNLALDGQ